MTPGVIRYIDNKIRIPRRMDQQHASSNRAMLVFGGVLVRGAILLVAAGVSSFSLVYSFHHFGISGWNWLLVAVAVVVLLLAAASEASSLFIPFHTFSQLESFGRSRWANRNDLGELDLIRKVGESSDPPKIAIAKFGLRHEVALPVLKMLQHLIVFGPTGSGKTEGLVVPICRQWLAQVGSIVSVSAKEDVAQMVGLYTRPENVFVLNLSDATRSDRIDLFSPARYDQAYAQAIAAMMVKSNADSTSSASQFFDSASTALVKSLILFLTHKTRQVTIDDLYSLLSRAGVKGNADDKTKDQVFENLDNIMLNSGIREIVEQFRIFANVEKETKWNIIISLSTRLEAFRATQDIQVILTPPDSREERAGIKLLDLSKLRQPGTAVFIVIDEAQAKSLQNVVPTILGTIMMYLRQTGSDPNVQSKVLFAVDEAGQYYQDQLLADITLGRSRLTSLLLCFQSYEQIVDLYGQTSASAIFECALTKIFLPGLAGVTARKASESLGFTTAVQTSRRDNRNDAFDGVQGTEIKRELMTPEEVRQMVPFQEMLVVHGNCLPIKGSFLPAAKEVDSRPMPLQTFAVTKPDQRPAHSIEAILSGQVSTVTLPADEEFIQLRQSAAPDAGNVGFQSLDDPGESENEDLDGSSNDDDETAFDLVREVQTKEG